MAESIALSNCQLQIWRPDSSKKSLALEGLQFCFSPNGDVITVKQFSELAPTNSFVVYKLQTSNCTYLSSEYLSADVKIICLRLDKSIAATIHVDGQVSPQDIADEVTTLEMCPMANTKLPAGCKIDLIIPQNSSHTTSISQLLKIFGDGPKKEKRLSAQVQFPTLIQKDKDLSKPVTLSNEDLDCFETSTMPKLTRDRSDVIQGSKLDPPPQQRNISSLRPNLTKTPDEAKNPEELEQYLKDTWDHRQEFFQQESGSKSRQNTSMALRANLPARAIQPDRTFGNPVPDPRETGGYLQDPNRDYSRPDSEQSPTRNTTATRGQRGRRGRGQYKAASFIPRVNPPPERPEPKW